MSFITNLNWRYATKEFSNLKVSSDVLDKILEAIRLAPSSFGIQPYHITVIENNDLKNELNTQSFWEQKQVKTCSHLLVFCIDLDIDKRAEDYVALALSVGRKDVTDDPEFDYAKEAATFGKKIGTEWATEQLYIALGFALAACAELQVDSCPMEGADFIAIKQALNLPKNLEAKVLLPIGYRSSNDTHAQDQKIRFSKKDLFDWR